MEEDEAPRPRDVRFLGPDAVGPGAQSLSHLVEKFWRIRHAPRLPRSGTKGKRLYPVWSAVSRSRLCDNVTRRPEPSRGEPGRVTDYATLASVVSQAVLDL